MVIGLIWKATSDYNASDFPFPSKNEFILWDKTWSTGFVTAGMVEKMKNDYNRLWSMMQDYGAKRIQFKQTTFSDKVGIWFDKNKVKTIEIHNDPKPELPE